MSFCLNCFVSSLIAHELVHEQIFFLRLCGCKHRWQVSLLREVRIGLEWTMVDDVNGITT